MAKKKYKCKVCKKNIRQKAGPGRSRRTHAGCAKKKKTPVRKKKKMKGRPRAKWVETDELEGYRVVAYYSTKKHGWGALDAKIRKTAGRREDGAGTMLATGVRDLDFSFKRKDAAERALKRLRKLKGVSKAKMHTEYKLVKAKKRGRRKLKRRSGRRKKRRD